MNSFLAKAYRHLYFRILQLFRVINLSPNIGLAYVIQVLLFIFIKVENNNYYPYIFLIPIFVFHLKRKDIFFLQHIFPNNWKIILLIENLFIFLFISISSINYKLNYSLIIPILIITFFFTYNNKK